MPRQPATYVHMLVSKWVGEVGLRWNTHTKQGGHSVVRSNQQVGGVGIHWNTDTKQGGHSVGRNKDPLEHWHKTKWWSLTGHKWSVSG